MKRFLWVVETLIVFPVVLFLGVLPRRLSLIAGEFLGLCMYLAMRNRKRIALKNIEIAQRAGGDASKKLMLSTTPLKIVRTHFMSLGRSLSELSMISLGRDSIIKDIVFEGIEHYNEAKAKGRGVLIITGHCGNWELLSLAVSWKGFPISIIVRRLNNPYLNKFVERLRTRFGNKMIYKSGALKEIIRVLKKGENAGILVDQSVVEDEAVITEFFGEKVYSMKIPALLAVKTGAAVVPLFINYLGRGKHRVWIGKGIKLRVTGDLESDVVFNTQIFSNCIEKYIKENPSEWLWIHRRWKLSHGRRY